MAQPASYLLDGLHHVQRRKNSADEKQPEPDRGSRALQVKRRHEVS